MEPSEHLQFFGYSIAYFDTNIYGMLIKQPESWKPLRALLIDHNLLLAVSDTNILELSDAAGLHRDLACFLLQVPSAMLQPTNQIIEDEVQAYLNGTTVNPVFGPITSLILESNDPLGALENLI